MAQREERPKEEDPREYVQREEDPEEDPDEDPEEDLEEDTERGEDPTRDPLEADDVPPAPLSPVAPQEGPDQIIWRDIHMIPPPHVIAPSPPLSPVSSEV